jgi:hypothetical protein
MKISSESLLQKLDEIDHALLELWVKEDENDLSDDEKWEIFVKMLEKRVEILKTCFSAKVPLNNAQCFPQWLERLTQSRKELRLREVKILYDELRKQKKISKYRKVGRDTENDAF